MVLSIFFSVRTSRERGLKFVSSRLDRAAKKSHELRLWRQVVVLSLNDMAEKKKPVRKGGRYCVAGAPNNQSCTNTNYTPGISMYQFPVDRAVREKWLKFVQRHRVDFQRADFKACLIMFRPFR